MVMSPIGPRPRMGLARAGCAFVLTVWAATAALAADCGDPAPLRFESAGKISRSSLGFTQGLEFHSGQLYESTGSHGENTRINAISLSGQVTTLADRGTGVFGEGLTILNDHIFQLTWRNHDVFAYDLDGKLLRTMSNPRSGWGLTNDGKRLVFSDGEGSIYFANPRTFAIENSVKIRSSLTNVVKNLNELEFVDGKVFGNVFTSRSIVRLDPATGCVDAAGEMDSLWNLMSADEVAQIDSSRQNVLNGIAYDSKTALFYLTGKRWKSIFVGRFVVDNRRHD